MEYLETSFRHRIYLAGPQDGYPSGRLLVFRERVFRIAYRPGLESATAPDVESARAVAKALFLGLRAEDLLVQRRDAERECREREGAREAAAEGGPDRGK